ncbi:MAG: cell division topological specificity factor MinE [Chloroflexota bacterium]|nr:cell division topological specificity factor MinE [Chloroflexota bacterium]
MGLLSGLFSKRETPKPVTSSGVAKERLQLALVYDRVKISPEVLETIKEEIVEVISKHFDIDRQGMEITLGERNDRLEVNIPVRRSKVYNQNS